MSTVIQIDHLYKQYRLGQIGGKRLVDDLSRWWAQMRGNEDPLSKVGASGRGSPRRAALMAAQGEVLWALRDVSCEIKVGEVLGIIGRNGAGKSTLLKILSRVTAPSNGEVRVKGRIASLLEVGTGFHPDLTGRDNVYLNGAILGMTKAEVARRFDEIVAFSGVEQFIDTPVKRYSSGMTVRLAFAVAAHLEPEIMIVDEVLAVGDASFQKKCLGKMQDVAGEGRTVLFVSHNMQAIRTLCSRGVVLDAGGVVCEGPTDECVGWYESAWRESATSTWQRTDDKGKHALSFESASCELVGTQPRMTLRVSLTLKSHGRHAQALVALDIVDSSGSALMQAIPRLEPFISFQSEPHHLAVTIDLPALIPGVYGVTLWAGPHNRETLHEVRTPTMFEILESPTPGRTFPHSRDHGVVVPSSSIDYQATVR